MTDFVMSRIAQSRGLRTTGMVAPVQWDIPREAVEEALVNALVHRNWRYSASVEVRLFADRLEIWTPGKLAEGLTIEKLYKTHGSYPVNDLVLKTFDFAGIIESLGTGIKRIIDACRKNGNPPPKFEQDGATFVVTLRKRIAPSGRSTGLKNDPMSGPLNEVINEAINEAIKEAIKSNPGINKPRIIKAFGKSRATIERALKELLEAKIVEHRGSKKTGGYYVIDPGESKDALMDGEMINETINETIKSNPGIGLLRLSAVIGKSRATVARAVAALVAEGLIEHRGSKKTGGYYLVEKAVAEATAHPHCDRKEVQG